MSKNLSQMCLVDRADLATARNYIQEAAFQAEQRGYPSHLLKDLQHRLHEAVTQDLSGYALVPVTKLQKDKAHLGAYKDHPGFSKAPSNDPNQSPVLAATPKTLAGTRWCHPH